MKISIDKREEIGINKKELFNLPNLLTLFRFALIPFFVYYYLTAQTEKDYLIASTIVLFSSLTDLLDGYIARHCGMVTITGQILDPIADKFTHAALAFCLVAKYPLMWLLCLLMIVKESYMAYMGVKFLRKGKMLSGASMCGKVATTVLFIGMLILFVVPEIDINLANILILIMFVFLSYAFYGYYRIYERNKSERE